MITVRLVTDEPELPSTAAPAWESVTIADQVQQVLDALEAPPIDQETRLALQRYVYRRQKYGDLFHDDFGSDSIGYITVLIRAFVETGNEDALAEPYLGAVRCAWSHTGSRSACNGSRPSTRSSSRRSCRRCAIWTSPTGKRWAPISLRPSVVGLPGF